MTTIGYARVSTTDQDTSVQEAVLKSAGCDIVRFEQCSGTSLKGRTELQNILDFVRQGDTLVVTRIDRLARSIGDLQDIVRALKAKGATLKATEQPIDTSTAAGKCFFDMLGVFAEFETNLRRERQLEGIAKAKAEGVYRGRPAKINSKAILELKEQGLNTTEIARKLGIHRSSIYRLVPTETGAAGQPSDIPASIACGSSSNAVPTLLRQPAVRICAALRARAAELRS